MQTVTYCFLVEWGVIVMMDSDRCKARVPPRVGRRLRYWLSVPIHYL